MISEDGVDDVHGPARIVNRAAECRLTNGSEITLSALVPTVSQGQVAHANEQGSGGPRRVFNTVTDLGRVLFLRAAKWAMGETLQPYQGFNIIDVTPAGAQAIKLSWQGSVKHSYTVQASADLSTWQTLTGDVTGTDGALSRTLNIAAAPQTLYLRVARLP
jgi:hypothetical protein